MKKNENEVNVEKKDKKKNKTIDLIILLTMVAIIIFGSVFAYFNFIPTDDVLFMEISRSDGPIAESYTDYLCSFYQNSDNIKVKITGFSESSNQSSNTETLENIDKNLIENFEKALIEYINQNVENNYIFSINDRYTIIYNNSTIIVPNPRTAERLGYEPSQYEFYNTVKSFLSNILY